MTGNVDEWTHSARSTGFASVLKGGYWGPVRARCRPATRAHNEDFVAYQQGFRCCGEADTAVPAPRPAPSAPMSPPLTPPVAGRADGGAPAAAGARARGAGPTADLSTEWDHRPSDDGDEVIAIGRARVGPACSATPGADVHGSPLTPGAAVAVVGLTAAFARRRRRGR
jgi:MYXO-CTERM domain-containing protein